MWKQGSLTVRGEVYKYYAKVYETGSEFGIDGGKISKLQIVRNDMIVYNYDRGLDVPPVDEGAQLALEILLHTENH